MWYKQSEIFKESKSMGIYVESIAKNLARLFMKDLRQEVTANPQGRNVYDNLYNVRDAIRLMNVDNAMKYRLFQFFRKLKEIRITITNATTSLGQAQRKRLQNEKLQINPGGYFDGGLGVIQLDFLSSKRIDKQTIFGGDYEYLYNLVLQTLRHEIEHYGQVPKTRFHNLKNFRRNYKNWLDEWAEEQIKSYSGTRNHPYKYYTHPSEIEAFVTAWYQSAKRLRVPFYEYLKKQIVRKVLQPLYEQGRQNGLPNEIIADTLLFIRNKYWEYAMRRYPQLQSWWKENSQNINSSEEFQYFYTEIAKYEKQLMNIFYRKSLGDDRMKKNAQSITNLFRRRRPQQQQITPDNNTQNSLTPQQQNLAPNQDLSQICSEYCKQQNKQNTDKDKKTKSISFADKDLLNIGLKGVLRYLLPENRKPVIDGLKGIFNNPIITKTLQNVGLQSQNKQLTEQQIAQTKIQMLSQLSKDIQRGVIVPLYNTVKTPAVLAGLATLANNALSPQIDALLQSVMQNPKLISMLPQLVQQAGMTFLNSLAGGIPGVTANSNDRVVYSSKQVNNIEGKINQVNNIEGKINVQYFNLNEYE